MTLHNMEGLKIKILDTQLRICLFMHGKIDRENKVILKILNLEARNEALLIGIYQFAIKISKFFL